MRVCCSAVQRLLTSRSPVLAELPTVHKSHSIIMAGAAGGGGGWYGTAHNFHPHQPAFKHRWGAKLLGATMWFWIFYRARQDGPVLLVSFGLRSAGFSLFVRASAAKCEIGSRRPVSERVMKSDLASGLCSNPYVASTSAASWPEERLCPLLALRIAFWGT